MSPSRVQATPPSTTSVSPTTSIPREARKIAAPAMSSGVPMRRAGITLPEPSLSSRASLFMVEAKAPGAMALTTTFWGALERQPPGQMDQPGLGGGVGIGALMFDGEAVNRGDIDDLGRPFGARRRAQRAEQGLGQEEGGL